MKYIDNIFEIAFRVILIVCAAVATRIIYDEWVAGDQARTMGASIIALFTWTVLWCVHEIYKIKGKE
jgi:hypothetical protein